MDIYKKNKKILSENYSYNKEMEHDACGVGMIATTNGKKSKRVLLSKFFVNRYCGLVFASIATV